MQKNKKQTAVHGLYPTSAYALLLHLYLVCDELEILPPSVVWVQDKELHLPCGLTPQHSQDGVCQYSPSWSVRRTTLFNLAFIA